MTKSTKLDIFLILPSPTQIQDSQKRWVLKENGLDLGNGGSWCRDDGSLGKKYNIERIKKGNRIIAVKLNGYRKNPIGKIIPAQIKYEIHQKRCVILAVGNPECDHKDGRTDDPRLNDPDRITPDDSQPLFKVANNAKKQHCKECLKTIEDLMPKGWAIQPVNGLEMVDTCGLV